ncbi:MAG: nucleotidyltransferase family protein [Acidobacteria bacterium]|nr:nucleotidyltransferase family protein [Acidobacteriota bacterium]
MSVATKQELIELIQSHDAELKAFGVKRLGLFGSFVRNEAKPESDVDLLVEFTPGQKTFSNFMDLGFFLEELFGRKVDLLTPESLSPYIGPFILKEAEDVSFGPGVPAAYS